MPLTHCKPVAFLHTRDRDKARSFYRDVLGLAHTGSEEFAECFDMAGVPLRIVPIPDHRPNPHTVLNWMVEDIEAAIAELAAKGLAMEIYESFGQDEHGIWTAPGGGTRIAWFLDPDGNNLSLSQEA